MMATRALALSRPLLLAARPLTRLFSSSAIGTSASSSLTEQMRLESQAEMLKIRSSYKDQSSPVLFDTENEAKAWVDANIDTILLDCDGVVYRSPDPAPDAARCIDNLIQAGKQVLFVTNNASSNRRQLRDKLASILNLESLTMDMMIGSAYAAAEYCRTTLETGRLYVIGSQGLCEELIDAGFDVQGGPSTEPASMNRDDLAAYPFDEHPIDAVVVGHDVEFTFRKLSIANVLLQKNPRALLIATNLDAFDIVGDGRHIPGNGCVVKALEHCSARTAVVVGKPSPILAQLLSSIAGMDPARTLFVGDRLDTDICFGAATGMHTALVLTGVTHAKQLEELGPGTAQEPLPSHIVPHIGWLA